MLEFEGAINSFKAFEKQQKLETSKKEKNTDILENEVKALRERSREEEKKYEELESRYIKVNPSFKRENNVDENSSKAMDIEDFNCNIILRANKSYRT